MSATDANREGLLSGQPLRFARSAPAADRTVDAKWIVAAAQAKARIEIWNAIIAGPLNLANTTFKTAVMLIRCEFQERAVFSHARFTRGLVLSGTIFHKGADFSNATIEGDARLNNAQFLSGKTAFDAMHVSGNFIANHVHFRGSVRPIFQGSTIGKSAFFLRAGFDAGANFSSAHIGGDAVYSVAKFLGKADFLFICIEGNARFIQTTFGDEVNFSFAKVQLVGMFYGIVAKRKASFVGAKFLGNALFGEAESSGSAARFEQDAYFSVIEVASLADFTNVTFAGKTRFTRVQFSSSCSFRGARFEKSVSFNSARFLGPALFGEIHDVGVVYREAATFRGEAGFFNAHFASQAEFQKAQFWASTNFDTVAFAGNALFTDAQFRDGATSSFSFTRFEGDASFVGTSFEGNSNFFYATFRTVHFSETPARVTRFLFWEFIERTPKPGQEQFKSSLDLRGCTYDRIEVDWEPLLRYVDAPDSERGVGGPAPAGELREIAETAFHRTGDPRLRPYDRQPYAQLEKAFREAGRTQEADQVYLERRRVERQRMWGHIGFYSWREDRAEQNKPDPHSDLHEVAEHSERRPTPRATVAHALASAVAAFGDWIYWRGARYGVRPLRLLVFAALLLSWGAVVFHSSGAVHSKAVAVPANQARPAAATCPDHVRFSEAARLSLREFSPIDLPLLKDCEPSEKTVFHLRVSDWAAMLRITGWIIVPVGIAALTGLLRRAAH